MNLFDQAYENVTRGYCKANRLPEPTFSLPGESRDDVALEALIDEYREDLLSELRHEPLAEIISQEYELHETDLMAKLLVANALWNEKPETAYERMKVIDRLIYSAMHQIAEKKARKDLDL